MSVVPAQKEIGVWYNPLTWPGDIANSVQWLGIPAWVWLIGAGAIVYVLTRQDKPVQRATPTQVYITQARRAKKKVRHGR